MNIENIDWNTVCCGGCFYAEIGTTTGFAAVYKDVHTGAYRVRTYGMDKMPAGEEVTMDEAAFAAWLAEHS